MGTAPELLPGRSNGPPGPYVLQAVIATCHAVRAVVSAVAGQVSTLPSRGPKRRLVPAARFDELVSRAATVGVSVGHRAAQLLDGWCFPRGLFGLLAFPAVQAVFGGLAGGEELPGSRSGRRWVRRSRPAGYGLVPRRRRRRSRHLRPR